MSARGKRGLAVEHSAQGARQPCGIHVLQQVAARPRADGGEEEIVVDGGAQHHDRWCRETRQNLLHGRHAAARQARLDQAELGPLAARERNRLLGAGRLRAGVEAVARER